MMSFSHSKNLGLYQATDNGLSNQDYIDLIQRESQEKYPHLHVAFYPDWCMQAKISIKCPPGSLLHETPPALIDILQNANFRPEKFTHYLSHRDNSLDRTQYVLTNTALKKIGYQFVMKAIFGPAFISFWFRNESFSPRLDLPVFYALEILNRLSHKIREAEDKGLLIPAAASTQTSTDDKTSKTG